MVQRGFDNLSNLIEQVFAKWWGVGLYVALSLMTFSGWGWDGLDRFLYISQTFLVVLLIGAGRRNSLAAQAKLDTLTEGHDLDRAEELSERDIERRRPS